jgi:hypothetical protein
MKKVRREFIWNLLLIAAGAAGWHLAGKLRLLWWDYNHQRLLKETGALAIFDNPPPLIPESLTLLAVVIIALVLNRRAFAGRSTGVRVALVLAGAIGMAVLASALGIAFDSIYYTAL